MKEEVGLGSYFYRLCNRFASDYTVVFSPLKTGKLSKLNKIAVNVGLIRSTLLVRYNIFWHLFIKSTYIFQ